MNIGIGRLVGKEPAIFLPPLVVTYLLRLTLDRCPDPFPRLFRIID
jgi:hypothetical protein